MKKFILTSCVVGYFLFGSVMAMENTLLHEAIALGAYDTARALVMTAQDVKGLFRTVDENSYVPLCIVDNSGQTLYRMAVEHEDIELLAKIFENYDNAYFVNIAAKDGKTPLHFAIDWLSGVVDFALARRELCRRNSSYETQTCAWLSSSMDTIKKFTDLVGLLLAHHARYEAYCSLPSSAHGSEYW